MGSPGMGNLWVGKKRVFVPADHQFQVIFLCTLKKGSYITHPAYHFYFGSFMVK